MAKLYFYYASMNAGKSSNLLQAAFNYGERGMKVMLWTAAIDNRESFGAIASRIGLHADAHRFGEDTDLFAAVEAEHQQGELACALRSLVGRSQPSVTISHLWPNDRLIAQLLPCMRLYRRMQK